MEITEAGVSTFHLAARVKGAARGRDWLHAARLFALLAGLLVLAVAPRLAATLGTPWLDDEVVNVGQLVPWIANHAGPYLFQLQASASPPGAATLAPPLFPVLATLAVEGGRLLHLSNLLSARGISLIAGTLTCLVVFWIASRLWSPRAGTLAAGLLAVLPVAVVASATASAGSLLALEVTLLIAAMIAIRERPSRGLVILAGLLSGVGLLTDLSFLAAIVWSILLITSTRATHRRASNLVTYLTTTILTPIILWPGARDPRYLVAQIQGAAETSSGVVQPFSNSQVALYYPLMLLGTLPDVVAVILVAGVAFEAITIARRRKVNPWMVAMGGLLLLELSFTTILVGASTRHVLASVEPLVALGIGYIVDRTIKLVDLREGTKSLVIAAILVASTVPLVQVAPSDYNAFSNALVGGPTGSLRFYFSGDGEGIEQAASLINQQTPQGTIVASVSQSGPLLQAVTGGRGVLSIRNDQTLDAAQARGASLVVLYASQIWSGQTTPLAASALALPPAVTFPVAGVPDVYIYNLTAEPRVHVPVTVTWSAYQRDPAGEVVTRTDNGPAVGISFRFLGSGLHWAGIASTPFPIQNADRIAFQVSAGGSTDDRYLYVDLLPANLQPDDPYLRYALPLDDVKTNGSRFPLNLEIPFSLFQWVAPNGSPVQRSTDHLSGQFVLRLGVDSHNSAEGDISIAQLTLVTLQPAASPSTEAR